ncbi:MAG: 16S rRNA (guanine(527)-N(7))-methyltransferase RsmG [Cyanobacteria bacterium]|nr:16S rRNA (guanine(527)-N(7))-methyltransferase RsmG [Cyanobacteriota bacterium]MDW8201216.1 16S rRNA (guanine(527)-N(7))-methyltransferase RsmG [Cyanobacteriota bacterium SKYGB_h_bin112]
MNTPQLPHRLDLWQHTVGWQPTVTQLQQFQRLYELILTANQHLNLTRITEPNDFWEKHLWDSIRGVVSTKAAALCASHPKSPRVIDIGTGAGFPGLPIAIAYPTWHITLVDSTRKKIAFVERAIAELGLTNAYAIAERVERLAAQPRYQATYDLALVRAVATVDRCVHYALPMLHPSGMAVLYRGRWHPSDTTALQALAHELGAYLAPPDQFTTPLTQSQRCCLYLHKQPVVDP